MSSAHITKRVLALPRVLYHARAGWLLGHRFLLLAHRGRRTGRRYETVLEVVCWRPDTREATVMAGLGRRSQWYRNVRAGGALEARVGRERFDPAVRELPRDEAADVLATYERRHRVLAPIVRSVLSWLSGERHDGSRESRRRIVAKLPLVVLRARDREA